MPLNNPWGHKEPKGKSGSIFNSMKTKTWPVTACVRTAALNPFNGEEETSPTSDLGFCLKDKKNQFNLMSAGKRKH